MRAVHLEDFRERGVVDGLVGETFAESYARFCLDGALPVGFRDFWLKCQSNHAVVGE
jgi:hypothetical protein